MILRYSLHYLVARGIPALINFLAIAIYTRLLTPVSYGYYILILAGTNVVNLAVFQWLRLALVRYLPACSETEKEQRLLGTVGWSYLGLMLIVGTLGGLIASVIADPVWQRLLLLAVWLIWTQVWFELNTELLRARLQTRAYGWATGVRSIGALGLGTLFIWSGLEAYGPLLGLVLSMAGVSVVFIHRYWRTIRMQVDWEQLRTLLRYGLPLAGSLTLNLIIAASDRFLIAWLLDEAHAGIYAAGYDLAYQPIILLMYIINLAVYPLIVRAWEQEGKQIAYTYLVRNVQLLLGIGVPLAVGISVLSNTLTSIMLGSAFQSARAVLPWIAFGTLLEGLRIYHADLAFHLEQRTAIQLKSILWGALINVGLNLIWIPQVGMIGAAWATVVACSVALCLSIWWGRSMLPLPWGGRVALYIGMAGLVMGLSIWALQGIIGGIWAGLAGFLLYGILSFIPLRKKVIYYIVKEF